MREDQVEGSSTESQTILSGNYLTVRCDEDGYYGGGSWYCKYSGEFDGKACEKETFSKGSYAVEGFHCDLNSDGIVDEGEEIDFPDHSFVTKWRVTEGDLDIELPIIEDERLDFYVDWGDGKCSRINNDSFDQRIHSYASGDDYRVRIIGSVLSWGGSNSSANYRNKIIEVLELGDVFWENLKNAFSDLTNLTYFSAVYTNTSNVTDMASIFQNSSNIESFIITGITTQLVEDMSYMFSGLAIEELDISHFVTPKLINMEGMFSALSNLIELSIMGMITENVTTMENLFYDSTKLVTINFGDFFETTNVTTMSNMFRGTKIVNLDLSFFDTTNVIDMSNMFEDMSELLSIIWGSTFYTNNVIYMNGMFSGAAKITELDLSHFNTQLVINMSEMFKNTTNIINIYLGNLFVTTNVLNLFEMFYGSNVGSLDLTYFDNINVTNIGAMFQDTTNLQTITLPSENFVTSKIDDLSNIFKNSAVTNLDLSAWDTSAVTNMSSAFEGTSALSDLILGGSFDTGSVENFSGFLNGSSVSSFDFSSLNTSSAIDLSFMLANMANQEEFDLTGFNTSNVTNLEGMLQSLASVTSLDISLFDTANVANFTNFLDANTLDTVDSINLGVQSNEDVIPAGYDTNSVTIERICSNDFPLLDVSGSDQTEASIVADYFNATVMSISSVSSAVEIKCNNNPGKSDSGEVVVVSCDGSTGDIVANSGDINTCLDD